MVELETDGIDVARAARPDRGRRHAEARPHHPELPEPGRLHALARQAHRAARARRRARLHDLRGRPVQAHPLQRRRPADDALDGRATTPSSTRPRSRRPSAPASASATSSVPPSSSRRSPSSRRTRTSRRTWSPRRSSTSSASRARSTTPSPPSRPRSPSASRRSTQRCRSTCPRRATRSPRAATSCGSSCPRAPTSPRMFTAAAERGVQFVKGTDFLLEGGENTLRLAYSGVTNDRIDEGVKRLAEAYRSLAGDRRSGVAPVASSATARACRSAGRQPRLAGGLRRAKRRPRDAADRHRQQGSFSTRGVARDFVFFAVDAAVRHRRRSGRDEIVVAAIGELDLQSAPPARSTLAGFAPDGLERIVVDLRQVEFIDSTGLRVLLGLHQGRHRDAEGPRSIALVTRAGPGAADLRADRHRRALRLARLTPGALVAVAGKPRAASAARTQRARRSRSTSR